MLYIYVYVHISLYIYIYIFMLSLKCSNGQILVAYVLALISLSNI